MNAISRNSYGVTRLGLCLAGMLGFVNSSQGGEEAASRLEKFELNIVDSTIGADEILAGDLTGGVGKINSALSQDSEYTEATNLCAAYTARGEFASAKEYCQAALKLSRTDRHARKIETMGYIPTRSRQAMALNNFGVWHALQGNTEQAREYFEAAGNKDKRLSAASARNLSALEQRVDVKV